MTKADITTARIGFTGDELRSRLRQYDRAPFTELLARFMECMPSEGAVRAFAARNPDKFIAALATIQRMAGYTDKTESTVNINLAVAVGKLSDSQLEDKMRAMGIDPGALAPKAPLELSAQPESAQPSAASTDEPSYLRSTRSVKPTLKATDR